MKRREGNVLAVIRGLESAVAEFYYGNEPASNCVSYLHIGGKRTCANVWSESHRRRVERRNSPAVLRDGQNRTTAEGRTEKLTSCTQRWSESLRQRVERGNSLAVLRDGQNRTGTGSNGETHSLYSEMVSESHRKRNRLGKLPVETRVKCQQEHFQGT